MTAEVWSQSDMQAYARGESVPKRAALSTADAAKVRQLAKGVKRERGTMNKTEGRYANELTRQHREGQILWWEFEAVKVRLADNTFLTPDFAVIAADGFLELHDVKGRKGKGYYCEEDAKIKLKVVAERFPARVRIVWEDKSGAWLFETL